MTPNGIVRAMPRAACASRTAASRRSLTFTAFEYVVRGPLPPNTSVIGAWTLFSVKFVSPSQRASSTIAWLSP